MTMLTIDLARFQPLSHWADGHGESNEHWCFAHPSLPYVTLAVVSRVRGEVTVSAASCSFLMKRAAIGARMAAETLLAASEFASKLNASPTTEQTSCVGHRNELDGEGVKSADGTVHQPSRESSSASGPSDWTSESEVAQAPQTRSLAEVSQ